MSRVIAITVDPTCERCASAGAVPPSRTEPVAGYAVPRTGAATGLAVTLELLEPGNHAFPTLRVEYEEGGSRRSVLLAPPVTICGPLEQCDV